MLMWMPRPSAWVNSGGTIVVPKMAIPTVGWLTYGHDTEGNIFGMMQMMRLK
jgi:predicted enzyme related to lactoylglutathione lyase